MFPPLLTKHIVHPLRRVASRWHRDRHSIYLDLERSQRYPLERLIELQVAKLRKLLADSATNVPYYAKLLNDAGVNPETADHSDLLKLPPLTKSIIRENFDNLTNLRFRKADLKKKSSGGSTGEPVHVLQTRDSKLFNAALAYRNNLWTGWYPGAVHYKVWGAWKDLTKMDSSPKKRLFNYIYNFHTINAFSVTDETLKNMYNTFRRRPPTLLESYSNILDEFSKFIKHNQLEPLKVAGVVSSAGSLYGHQRKTIQRTISPNVFNRYGCREFGGIAHECEAHDGMHINMERFIVEYHNQDQTGLGEVLITDLENPAFPMIRYKIGDMARPLDAECGCGRKLLSIESVEGRTTDMIITPEGTRVSGLLFPHLFKEFDGIVAGQVIQDSVDEIDLLLKTRKSFSDHDQENLVNTIAEYVGASVKINVKHVENIKITPTGKYRPVISSLSSPGE